MVTASTNEEPLSAQKTMRWKSGVEILQVPWQMSMFLKDRVNQLGWFKQSTVDQLPYQYVL